MWKQVVGEWTRRSRTLKMTVIELQFANDVVVVGSIYRERVWRGI